MTREEKIYKTAAACGVCDKMKGSENLAELAALFFTPQGLEFAQKYNFPHLRDLRPFRGLEAEHAGFYIETPVSVKNKANVALFGESAVGVLEYDDPTKAHHVVVMHGAKVKIIASGYAVVNVVNVGGGVEIDKRDNAIVI